MVQFMDKKAWSCVQELLITRQDYHLSSTRFFGITVVVTVLKLKCIYTITVAMLINTMIIYYHQLLPSDLLIPQMEVT